MNTREMIKYLKGFDPDSDISVIVANPPERLRHQVKGFFCITDYKAPAFCLEIGGGIPFDEEMIKAAEEEENDF